VSAWTDWLCKGESATVGLLGTRDAAPRATVTAASGLVTHAVVMVRPAAGSLKLWPTSSGASASQSQIDVSIAGLMSRRSLLLLLDSVPRCTRIPFGIVVAIPAVDTVVARKLSKPIALRASR